MALTKITGMPLISIGCAGRQGSTNTASLAATTVDATNEACIMTGRLYWEDMGSHTVSTAGSSSIQWRTANVTFANVGTAVSVGIAAVDVTAGPPARAVNVADVITFDVAAVFVGGGGGITANAWQTSVPTIGTKTIASGDLIAIAIQATTRAGADSITVGNEAVSTSPGTPGITDFTGGSYTTPNRLPNAVLVASDGTRGYIYGGFIASVGTTTQTWNSGSATKEYGNILRVPFPMTAYGVIVGTSSGGDCDYVLYSDPLGTPAAQKTVSVDLHTVQNAIVGVDTRLLFASSFDLAANTDYAIIMKPTTTTNVALAYKTYNDANHQNSEPLGTDSYAINRASGAFASQNANKDRYAIGLLVGAFDAGGGGAGGGSVYGGLGGVVT